MTIAGKINVLFIATALALVLAFAGFTAFREYQFALDRVVDLALAEAAGQPELQVDLYRREDARLQRALASFLALPAVNSAVARDGLGEALARREDSNGSGASQPPFKLLRGDVAAAEPHLLALDAALAPADTGLWAAWRYTDLPMYLTLPVFTAVNPGQRGLTPQDFFVAQADPEANASQRVIGYLQLEISRADLLAGIWPDVQRVFTVGLGLSALCALVVALVTRRITRDLARLSRFADEAASGKLETPVDMGASSEFKDIAHVLNSLIGGFARLRREVDTEQHLLNMKVDERTSQLSSRDQALNKAAEEITETRTRLQQLAYYDNLTALPNRQLFTEQLDLLLGLNQRNGHTLALLFLNLDNFKRINESLGYSAGDQVLLEVGKRLADSVRESDPVAHYVDGEHRIDVSRLGGDEFTVILNQLDSVNSAGVVSRRLLEALQRPMIIDGQEVVVSPSIGVAIAPRDGTNVEILLRAAGVAMHHAKESVREKVLFFSQHMDATGVGRLKLESELRRAVERKQLVLHYQPQVNTLTGAVAGAEALLRWDHPEHGMIPPFQFIPLAEEIGVIGELGDWVLAEACRQMKAFDEQGLTLPRVAVNVSAFQFTAAFCDSVRSILQQHGLPASRLELGLSEDILMDQDRDTNQSLRELKALGVHLSVDDFGTRYAPLSYLSHFSLDELKIDRSFVVDCDRNDNNARLVIAIISMASSLGLGVVAEGVETEEQYRFLIDKGATVIQGYLFSKPVPAAELQQMLAPWHFMAQLQRIQA
ncbi:MAG: EAL domain-containing protein [Halioglobus sp.]|nr:EAL domain-containing protein [Halioglobus sp.]